MDLILYQFEEIPPVQLASKALRDAATRAPHPGTCYVIPAHTDDGRVGDIELVWFARTGRTGVAWLGVVEWLDASSAEEALGRWQQTRSGLRPA